MDYHLDFRLVLIWLCFLIRGAAYCTLIPLWEGFDEYAHFARFSQGALPKASDGVSREIEATFHLLPLPDQLAWMGPFAKIHPQWWALPEQERVYRRAKLRDVPPKWAQEPSVSHFDAYEAQQPPLYYWMLAGPAWMSRGWPLPDRVLLLRLLSILIASAVIPCVYCAARPALGNKAALTAAALLAVSPMLAIDTARVANDCVAMAVTGLLVFLLAKERPVWWQVGLVLGAALLAKAYLLTLVPAIVLFWRRKPGQLVRALAITLAVAGWWYVRNIVQTGKLTGWEDDAPFGKILASFLRVDWVHAVGAVFKSGLWFGGWSFLTVKAWMYNLLLGILFSCVALALRKREQVWLSCLVFLFFLAGIAYDVTAEFVTQHTSSAPGWYIWGICPAIAILVAGGAGRAGVWLVCVIAIFDFYSANFVLLPYYSGLAAHGRSFPISAIPSAYQRLGVAGPVWILAMLSTLLIMFVVLLANRSGRPENYVTIVRLG